MPNITYTPEGIYALLLAERTSEPYEEAIDRLARRLARGDLAALWRALGTYALRELEHQGSRQGWGHTRSDTQGTFATAPPPSSPSGRAPRPWHAAVDWMAAPQPLGDGRWKPLGDWTGEDFEAKAAFHDGQAAGNARQAAACRRAARAVGRRTLRAVRMTPSLRAALAEIYPSAPSASEAA